MNWTVVVYQTKFELDIVRQRHMSHLESSDELNTSGSGDLACGTRKIISGLWDRSQPNRTYLVRANSILASKIWGKIHCESKLGTIGLKQGSSSLSRRALASCGFFWKRNSHPTTSNYSIYRHIHTYVMLHQNRNWCIKNVFDWITFI